MAVTEDDCCRVPSLLAQAPVSSARRQTMPVHDPELSARQVDGRRLREPIEYRPVGGGPVTRCVVIASHGHNPRMILRKRFKNALGTDIARVHHEIAGPCDFGDARVQPAMGIGEKGNMHGFGHPRSGISACR